MSDKFYDVIVLVQRWIVALGAAYYGLSLIWGFPFADEINKSVAVFATFLATVVEIAKAVWKKNHTISITTVGDDANNTITDYTGEK